MEICYRGHDEICYEYSCPVCEIIRERDKCPICRKNKVVIGSDIEKENERLNLLIYNLKTDIDILALQITKLRKGK